MRWRVPIAVLLGACAAPPQRAGILVVSLDTLRADRLGAWGSTAGLTPNLDRFAAESVVFDRAFAQSNETLYSHAALFTSRYPDRLDAMDGTFRVPASTPTLADAFTGAGWATAGFVAGGHLSRSFGLDRGFAQWDDTSSWGSLRETSALALHWLDTRQGEAPFFLFVHAYDTHDRYLRPSPFGYAFADPGDQGLGARLGRTVGGASSVLGGAWTERPDTPELLAASPRFDHGRAVRELDPTAAPLSEADVLHLAALYDGAVAWEDACFGRFMAGLDARGLLDRITIVVLSDHGEELGEGGVFAHRATLDDAVTRVPLMVRLPGGAHGGRRLTGLVELVDVAPTLLDLAGVDAALYGDGQSLVRGIEGGEEVARSTAVSVGALRLLSVRGPTARLTAEGLSVDNPHLDALLAVAPLDGVSLRLGGDPAAEPTLRAAMRAYVEAR